MMKKLYTPKMDLKDVVIALIEIVNDLSWEQANREVSGQNYHLEVSSKLQKLEEEMNNWGKPV